MKEITLDGNQRNRECKQGYSKRNDFQIKLDSLIYPVFCLLQSHCIPSTWHGIHFIYSFEWNFIKPRWNLRSRFRGRRESPGTIYFPLLRLPVPAKIFSLPDSIILTIPSGSTTLRSMCSRKALALCVFTFCANFNGSFLNCLRFAVPPRVEIRKTNVEYRESFERELQEKEFLSISLTSSAIS